MANEKALTKPVSLRQFTVRDGDGAWHSVRVGETVRLEDGEPVVLVRAELLSRMLVYLVKFKEKVQRTGTNGLSRFMDPDDFELSVYLKGFTPEDFNALMSLATSMSDGLEFLKDVQTPQMARPMKDREQLYTQPSRKLGPGDMVDSPSEARRKLIDMMTKTEGDDDGR